MRVQETGAARSHDSRSSVMRSASDGARRPSRQQRVPKNLACVPRQWWAFDQHPPSRYASFRLKQPCGGQPPTPSGMSDQACFPAEVACGGLDQDCCPGEPFEPYGCNEPELFCRATPIARTNSIPPSILYERTCLVCFSRTCSDRLLAIADGHWISGALRALERCMARHKAKRTRASFRSRRIRTAYCSGGRANHYCCTCWLSR